MKKQKLAEASAKFFARKSKYFWFAAFLIVGAWMLPDRDWNEKGVTIEFEIAVHSSREWLVGQLFYSSGKKFEENEPFNFPYSQEADGTFKRYTFKFPKNKDIQRIRFDPLPHEGKITMRNVSFQAKSRAELDLADKNNSLIAINSIERITVGKDGFTVVSNGEDPHFLLTKNLPAYFGGTLLGSLRQMGLVKIVGLLILLFVAAALIETGSAFLLRLRAKGKAGNAERGTRPPLPQTDAGGDISNRLPTSQGGADFPGTALLLWMAKFKLPLPLVAVVGILAVILNNVALRGEGIRFFGEDAKALAVICGLISILVILVSSGLFAPGIFRPGFFDPLARRTRMTKQLNSRFEAIRKFLDDMADSQKEVDAEMAKLVAKTHKVLDRAGDEETAAAPERTPARAKGAKEKAAK